MIKSRKDVADQRQAADQQRQDGEKVFREISARLGDELSADRRQAIADVIKAVDTEIQAAAAHAADLRRQVAAAEGNVAAAQAAATAADAVLADTQAQLRDLPGRITALAGQVAALKNSSTTAADAGRATEALVLVYDLRVALDSLERWIDVKLEAQLLSDVSTRSTASKQAAAELVTKTDILNQLKKDQVAADQDLQTKRQARDQTIKTRLAAASVPAHQPATGSIQPAVAVASISS